MTMVFPVPVIRPDQYDSFRRAIGPELGDTFDQWTKLFQERKNEIIRRGETLALVPVDFDEFSRFCGATGTQPNLKTLLDFAITKNAAPQ